MQRQPAIEGQIDADTAAQQDEVEASIGQRLSERKATIAESCDKVQQG